MCIDDVYLLFSGGFDENGIRMSMRRRRDPGDEEEEEVGAGGCACHCLRRYDPREDPLEFASLMAMVALCIGIALVSVGYLVPRQYRKDMELPARTMEAIEIYYAQLARRLDVCIIVGMCFVGAGGLTMAGLLVVVMCRGELSHLYDSSGTGGGGDGRYYGSTHSDRTPIYREDMYLGTVDEGGGPPVSPRRVQPSAPPINLR